MRSTSPSRLPADSQAAEICERFRSSWQSGQQPNLAAYLQRIPLRDSKLGFRTLLEIELAERQRLGQTLRLNEYLDRFADYETEIQVVFATRLTGSSTETTGTFEQVFAGASASHSESTLPLPLPAECQQRMLLADRYRLRHVVGQGGFGEVWLAYDEVERCPVALKGPRPDRPLSPRLIELFLREGQRARDLNLRGMVRVRDVIEASGSEKDAWPHCFLVMDYAVGGSLGERVRRARRKGEQLSVYQIVDWIISLAEALDRLHRAGVIHRDIKPDNVLLDRRERPWLSDFGLAVTEEDQLQESAGVLGSLYYMSPEQARGNSHRVDSRTDIYSLGAVLYVLLSGGKRPYLADEESDYRRQLCDPEMPARPLPADTPRELAVICERCLATAPEQRYRAAGELAKALRRWRRQARWRQALPWVAAAGLLIALAAGYRVRPERAVQPGGNEQQLPELPDFSRLPVGKTTSWLVDRGRPIGWFAAPAADDLRFDAEQRTLELLGSGIRLVHLADLDTPSYRLAAGWELLGNPRLGAGICIGLQRRQSEQGEPFLEALALLVTKDPQQGPRLWAYMVELRRLDYPTPDVHLRGLAKPFPLTGTEGFKQLEMEVQDGRLISLLCDRVPVTERWLDELNRGLEDGTLEGGLGVLSTGSDTRFRANLFRVTILKG